MSLEKERGIVIESRSLGEIDQSIVILSSQGQKIQFIVKGIRKSKNRPIVATEIGSVISLDFYKHKNREIHHTKEIAILERFENLKSDYLGFLVINSFCELTQKMTMVGDNYSKIYELLEKAFYTLNELGFSIVAVPFFKIRLLFQLGLLSQDLHCQICDQDIFDKSSGFINPANMEIQCGDCRPENPNQMETLKLFRAMFSKKYAILKSEKISPVLVGQLDSILNTYIKSGFHLELNSFEILYQAVGTQIP